MSSPLRAPASRRRRITLAAAGVIASGAGVVAVFVLDDATVAAGDAGPSTTIVVASGDAPPSLDAETAGALARDVGSAWTGSDIDASVRIADGLRDYVEISGSLARQGATYTARIYRNFERSEMEAAGLALVPSRSGTTWVGATDIDLTSVYHLPVDGSGGVWIGVQPAVGERAFSVAEVQEMAESLALTPGARAIREGSDR